jgi:hypothetical protein
VELERIDRIVPPENLQNNAPEGARVPILTEKCQQHDEVHFILRIIQWIWDRQQP